MAINLSKGERFDLNKGLSKVGVGLGWEPNEGESQFDFDLDASAFMLGANKKLPQDEFFVFYNNPKSPDEAVESSGDDQTGGSSDGDDETLSVDLTKVDKRVAEIVFTVTIHDAEKRKQNFGQVRKSFIRIYNAINGDEIAKYELNEDFSVETAIEFGRLYRDGGQWKFEAMGIGYKGGLQYFVTKYA
ncbi:MAG: TerD family protein [Planctomycetes bacterium]|nr:TerD family protein [Planctomycetota bacterium]